MTLLAPHIAAFFQIRLPVERQVSSHTSSSYAYAFQLLLTFARKRLGVSPSALQLEQIDAALILAFLEHLELERHNSPASRNARLAAIKSFMRFIEYRVPSAIDQVRCVLAIPEKKSDQRLVTISPSLKCKPCWTPLIHVNVMVSVIEPCFTWDLPPVYVSLSSSVFVWMMSH